MARRAQPLAARRTTARIGTLAPPPPPQIPSRPPRQHSSRRPGHGNAPARQPRRAPAQNTTRSPSTKPAAKARHWPDNADKRTYGAGPFYGLLWRSRIQIAACDLHICEGLADGLRILRYATEPALVAVCAGTSYARIEPGYFDSLTLWPDADEPGVRSAAKAAQRWADQGYRVTIKRLAAGHDPASAPLQEPEHE